MDRGGKNVSFLNVIKFYSIFSRSFSEHATVRYIHYGTLTVALLSVGLLNNSVGLYLGVYLLLSSLISGIM
jgi:hypothetical protein